MAGMIHLRALRVFFLCLEFSLETAAWLIPSHSSGFLPTRPSLTPLYESVQPHTFLHTQALRHVSLALNYLWMYYHWLDSVYDEFFLHQKLSSMKQQLPHIYSCLSMPSNMYGTGQAFKKYFLED